MSISGDGNCLLHAVSICLWGLEDNLLLLRRLLYVSLVQDTSGQKIFQKRWLLHQRRIDQERPTGFNAQLGSNVRIRIDFNTCLLILSLNQDDFFPII